MSLARLLRFPHLPRDGAVLAGPLADRPEPSLQARRRGDQRRRVRHRLVRRARRPRRVPEHRAGVERRQPPGARRRTCSSGLFFAHIRAAIGSPVQQTNCHPFRHGRWLFMHNGFMAELPTVKRDLVLAIDESLYPENRRQADTEILFYLALTFGLEDDPADAVARSDRPGRGRSATRKGVKLPLPGNDRDHRRGAHRGRFRYSSEGKSRSLFFTRHVPTLRELYPERAVLQEALRRRPSDRLRADRRPSRRLATRSPSPPTGSSAGRGLAAHVHGQAPGDRSGRRGLTQRDSTYGAVTSSGSATAARAGAVEPRDLRGGDAPANRQQLVDERQHLGVRAIVVGRDRRTARAARMWTGGSGANARRRPDTSHRLRRGGRRGGSTRSAARIGRAPQPSSSGCPLPWPRSRKDPDGGARRSSRCRNAGVRRSPDIPTQGGR